MASRTDPQHLWKVGLALLNARNRYGAPDLVREVFRLQATHPLMRMANAVLERRENRSVGDAEYTQANSDRNKLLALERKLESQFLTELREGKLWAFGYSAPRKPTDAPCRLPIDLFEGKIDWVKSAIKGNGLEFTAVRVVASPAPGLVSAPRETQAPQLEVAPAAPGRPSRRGEIVAAWQALEAERKINRATSLRSHFALVRAKVHEIHRSDPRGEKGLGDKVLYQILSELWNRDAK